MSRYASATADQPRGHRLDIDGIQLAADGQGEGPGALLLGTPGVLGVLIAEALECQLQRGEDLGVAASGVEQVGHPVGGIADACDEDTVPRACTTAGVTTCAWSTSTAATGYT
jgi:hypothetical protein